MGYAPTAPGWPVAPPAPAPAPAPMPYPQMPRMTTKTEQGLGYVRWALVIGLTMQAVTIPLLVIVYALIVPFFTNPPDPSDPTFFSFIFGFLAVVCVTAIIGFIGVLMYLMGFYNLHEGRDEYGPVHAKNMERSLIFFIIAVVLTIVASSVGTTFPVGGGSFGGFGTLSAIGSAVGIARGLSVGLLLAIPLMSFQQEREKNLGILGSVVLAVGPAVGTVGALLLFSSIPTDPAAFVSLFAAVIGLAIVVAAIDLVAYVIFLFLYHDTYRRMRAGEFPAVYRPPMMYIPYYPPYIPPPYPMAPPYPAYPSPPTPAPSPPPSPPPEKPSEKPPES